MTLSAITLVYIDLSLPWIPILIEFHIIDYAIVYHLFFILVIILISKLGSLISKIMPYKTYGALLVPVKVLNKEYILK